MRNIFRSFGATIIVQICNLGLSILAARLLFPDGRGVVALAVLWSTVFSTIGLLNIDQGAVYLAATRPQDRARILTTTLILAVGLSTLTIPIAYLVLPMLVSHQSALAACRLFLLFIPLSFCGAIAISINSGMQNYNWWNVLRCMAPTFTLVIALVLGLGGRLTIEGFLAAVLIGHLLFVIIAIGHLINAIGLGTFDFAIIPPLIRSSLPFHLSAITVLIAQRIDQIGISFYLPAFELGYYIVAFSVTTAVNLFGTTIAAISLPKVSIQANNIAKADVFAVYFRFGIASAALVATVMFFVAPRLIEALFGTAYHPSVALSRILLLGSVPSTAAAILWSGFRAYNRGGPVLLANVVGLITSAVLLLLLLPIFGAVGAAWSIVTSQTLLLCVLLYFSQRLNIRLRRLLLPTFGDIQLLLDMLTGSGRISPRGPTVDGARAARLPDD